MNDTTPKKYRVALSFPKGQRDYVEKVAKALAVRFKEDHVLYDRFHTAEFADADLAFKLPDLYHKESDLIVAVLCGEYVEREWCGLEWRAIFAHIKEGNSKQVMLFKADDAEIPGLYGLDGSVPVDAFTPEEAARLILQRLARNEDKPRDFYLDGEGNGADVSQGSVIAVSKLTQQHQDRVFVGRDKELAKLDAVWADVLAETAQRTRIVSLVAIGGAGKTTVVARWKDALLNRDGHGWVERYFDWSFYSQGTRTVAGDASSFIAAALKFFGDPNAEATEPAWDKGARLAELVGRRRTLLVLDGLEPLQHPPGPQAGALQDEAMQALFSGLAQRNRGLCVVTTRERVADLDGGTGFQPVTNTQNALAGSQSHGATPTWSLDHLTDAGGAAVLREHGVTGPDDELQRAGVEVKGHALTLSLMGRYLKLAFDPPDIARRDEFHFAEADAETLNGHAFRVFAAYERWLERECESVRVRECERERPTRPKTAWGKLVQWMKAKPAAKLPANDGQICAAMLRLLGLFDRPATPDCLAALCAEPALPGLTEPLVGLSERQWTIAVNRLVELGLIETATWSPVRISGYGEQEAKAEMAAGRQGRTTNLGPPQPFENLQSPILNLKSLDSHPLLREYFGSRLREQGLSAAAHARLYEHLCGSVPYWPEGREGLLPLYQAVAHGCQAGRFQEVCDDVYCNRILRGTAGSHAAYSTMKLGLLGLDLGAVSGFFVEPWRRLAGELQPADQAWLLSEAAFRLRALNRLAEAREPMRATIELMVKLEEWKQAAAAANNLSELELTLGDVQAAEATASSSVTFADRSGNEFMRMAMRTEHADALHQAGRWEESRRLFAEAETLQAASQPEYPLLYSLPGFRYCDLLLGAAEREAWRAALNLKSEISNFKSQISNPKSEISNLKSEISDLKFAEVERRAEQALNIVLYGSRNLLAIALNHLTLGWGHLLGIVLAAPDADPLAARQHLDTALETLRQSNNSDDLPRALLPSAWLHAVLGEREMAQRRLDEAWDIATRGGAEGSMRLHLIDTLLHRARLFGGGLGCSTIPLSENGTGENSTAKMAVAREYPWPGRTPRMDLEEAGRLIDVCGYHRRDQELADALEALGEGNWVMEN